MNGVETSADGSVADDTTVMQRLDAMESRINELESENERLREELESEREARKALINTKSPSTDDISLGSVFIADRPAGSMVEGLDDATDTLADNINELEEQVDEEQQNRGQQDAKLRRRIAALAEKAGVEIHESDILGDDKITRVLKHGVDDVEGKPGTTDYRAQDVLRKIGKWGQKANDAHGKRILITSPTVVDRLDDYRDERLATSQVKRIFEKIEEWGADSPRTVSADFSSDVNKLKIELDTEAER